MVMTTRRVAGITKGTKLVRYRLIDIHISFMLPLMDGELIVI